MGVLPNFVIISFSKKINMRTIVLALFMSPFILSAQSNELYNLLGWNTPKQQQQLIAWYDLQDAATINISKPGHVFGINDKGIGKNHISQVREMHQPLLTRDEGFTNGPKKGILFANGGYMVYKFPSEKSVNSITSFVVCKNDIGGSKLLYDLSIEGGEGIASCYSGLNKIESRVPNSLGDFEPNFSNNPGKHLLISTKGSSGNIKIDLNDGLKYLGPGTRNFVGTSYNRIRLSTENGVAPTDGTLYELILFDYELSDKDFQIVKNYLEKKYEINRSSYQSDISEKVVKSFSEEEKIKIFNTRGYSVWQKEYDGMIYFSIKVPRKITAEDVIKYPEFKFTTKDFGKMIQISKEGVLDSKSLIEVIPPIYEKLDYRFENDKVLAFDGKKYFVINKKGEIIYTDTEKLKDYTLIQITGPFSVLEEQLRVVKNKLGKYGFINEKFDLVIPCLYDNVSSSSKAGIWFSVGYCIAKLNNKIGFINKLGVFRAINAEMIGFPYNTFNSEGKATYTLNKKMGVIDTNGVIIIQAKYDEVDLRGSNYTVKNGLKYGVIDNKGKIIVPIAYSGITNVGTLEQIQVKVGGDYRYYKELELIAQQSSEKSNTSRSSLIEGRANSTISNASNEISYVRLGDIDVLTSDLGEMNGIDAKNAIENLGKGWRLPNERELKLMFENQNAIGVLSKKEYKVINGYWTYTGNYLGEESEGRYLILRTFVDPGLILPFPGNNLPNKKDFYFVRAVRGNPTAKATKNGNQSVGYDFSELKSQGCDVIKSEYKQFAIQYINYRKRVKSNPSSLRIREDTDWENNLRKISDLVTDCAIKLKGGYALEVMGYGEKISSLMPIDPIKPSSSKNNSSVQNKSTSNTSQSKPSQTNNTVEKKVDLSTEVLSQVVSCKTCSNPVTIQKNVPRSPEFKNSFNEIGGITSSMCQKCNKTSLYNYEMKAGRFTRIN